MRIGDEKKRNNDAGQCYIVNDISDENRAHIVDLREVTILKPKEHWPKIDVKDVWLPTDSNITLICIFRILPTYRFILRR